MNVLDRIKNVFERISNLLNRTSNVLDRISPFKGALADALIHNGLTTDQVEFPGTPIAVTLDDQGAGVGFDMELWKLNGLTETKAIGIIADQGIGKTFTLSLMQLIMLAQDVGGKRCRVAYPSLKHNGGRPETAPLIEDILKCKIISPLDISLNFYGKVLGLTFQEQLQVTTAVFQFVDERKLSGEERKVLKHVLRQNFELDEPDIRTLKNLLKEYAPEGVVDPEGQKTDLLGRFQDKFYEAALSLLLTIDALEEGEFLNLFAGSGEEFAAMLEQRGVSWDMKDIDDRVRSLIEIVLAYVSRSALRPHPERPNDGPKFPNRAPHVTIDDEAYEKFMNLESARAYRLRIKTQRAHGITMITAFHRLRDLRESIGTADSEQARIARSVLGEIKIWLVGRQSRADLPDIRDFFDLPEYVIQSLPGLTRGQFWLIVPGLTPRLILVIGSPLALKHFVSDQANHSALQRYLKSKKRADYVEYLEDTTPPPEDETEDREEDDYEDEEGVNTHEQVTA